MVGSTGRILVQPSKGPKTPHGTIGNYRQEGAEPRQPINNRPEPLDSDSEAFDKTDIFCDDFLRGKYTPLNSRVNRKSDDFSVNSNVYSVP